MQRATYQPVSALLLLAIFLLFFALTLNAFPQPFVVLCINKSYWLDNGTEMQWWRGKWWGVKRGMYWGRASRHPKCMQDYNLNQVHHPCHEGPIAWLFWWPLS